MFHQYMQYRSLNKYSTVVGSDSVVMASITLVVLLHEIRLKIRVNLKYVGCDLMVNSFSL